MQMVFMILIYFIIYSFLGWVIESTYRSILEKRVINSGFLYGPVCPIYGIGAIIMYIFLEDVSNKPVVAFCLAFVVLSAWEYIVGVILEKLFHTKYWDYSDHKYNLQGRVCLMNSVFWGLLGVVFIEFIHPCIQQTLMSIDLNIIIWAGTICIILIIIDTIVSVAEIISTQNTMERVEELSKKIKEKLAEIKVKGKENVDVSGKSMQATLEELKNNRKELIAKSYKQINRMKTIFPTMKSEKISNFLKNNKK